MDEKVAQIKKAERLISLTQQSGWEDILKMLDTMWSDAYQVILSTTLSNGGIQQVLEARATIKVITDLVNHINSQIAYGEVMKEKSKPRITR